MHLTDEQKQIIREEEILRHEIRNQLSTPSGPSNLFDKIAGFFETKAGFWILTTVLAGLAATSFTSVQRYLDRQEIAMREAAERARQDMDTVLKLGPMLTSEKRTQFAVVIILLDGLALEKAVDNRVASQVKALVQNTLETGLKIDATSEEKAQAETIIAFADRARLAAIQSADSEPTDQPAAQITVSRAVDNASLPARVYLQIASEADRPKALAARDVLKGIGLIVPGIETVPSRKAPSQTDIRYCEGNVDKVALENLQSAITKTMQAAPKIIVLNPKQCGKVRFNHFEVWYAMGSQG